MYSEAGVSLLRWASVSGGGPMCPEAGVSLVTVGAAGYRGTSHKKTHPPRTLP